MNLTLSPQTGKFQVKLPCSITSDYDENETMTGLGTVSMSAQELIALADQIEAQLRKTRLANYWTGPDGLSATLVLLPNGTWSVWSSDKAPNLGPLRTQDDYRRQVVMMRAAGMHSVARNDV